MLGYPCYATYLLPISPMLLGHALQWSFSLSCGIITVYMLISFSISQSGCCYCIQNNLKALATGLMHSLCFLLFQVVEMDPTDNQDELMHELIRGSSGHIAPEFDEDENDGSQFLNLHYHGDEEQDISGEEEGNVEEAEV